MMDGTKRSSDVVIVIDVMGQTEVEQVVVGVVALMAMVVK